MDLRKALYQPRKPSVLVVDDHPLMLNVTKRQLESSGCEVTAAADGAEALQRFLQAPFDLVLCDISMPELDGPDLAREILSRSRDQRIVLMSADPDTNPRIPGVPFVVKPLHSNDLERLVANLRPGVPPAAGFDDSFYASH